jgi:triacylglycerol lipase
MLWRGLVAGATGAAMGTGLYPFVPALGLMAFGREPGVARLRPRDQALEWGASVAGVLSRPLGFLGERLTRGRGPRPIIVVHGYAMNRACFQGLALRLAAAKLGPVYGFEYWSLGKVSSASHRLHSFIEKICEMHGCDQVDIIGHSMGGLVGRYYLTLGPGRGAGRVANLITLGTPHGGSVFSGLGIGRAKIELSPRTPFFQRLSSAKLPENVGLTVIWSRADVLVASHRQAHWSGAEELVHDDLGHVSLLYSRRVAGQIIERLSRPRRKA